MPAFPDTTIELDGGMVMSSLTVDDAPALVDAFADEKLRRWLPVPSPYTLETATRWCGSASVEMRESGTGFVLAVRQGGVVIASVDAKRVDWRARTLELSYWTVAEHRGRGVMTMAVARTAEWLIADLGFQRVELRVAPGNAASLAVAERAGFVREGTARNAGFTDAGRVDLVIWSRIPADGPATT